MDPRRLQITIASSVTGVLTQPDTLDTTSTEIGLIASVLKAEGKSLEDITKPLTATTDPAEPAPATA